MPTYNPVTESTTLVVTSTASEAIPLGGVAAAAVVRASPSAGPARADYEGAGATPGALLVQVWGSGWVGTLTVQRRLPGVGAPWAAAQAVPVAGGDPLATITAPGLYLIDAVGCEVQLDHTRSTGILTLGVRPVGV